ncbi:hypothetical protein CSB45_05400 [candidate division KSB3 bacterium]|uniref:Glycosyltransferase family 1 protein n=1 Tax=candidate division KSB3 bacterium TaxID=2044937 RepID=A0A2G6E7Q8_9BACT|nr:MAG: hypothetical protein CSB45_05400 [candidate division KSB3 bacterium]PIE30483.1 MAG: hypothetical protein CSA57_04165 [candidate division KSB3 bacterium]
MIKVLHILTRLIRGGADESTLATVAGLQDYDFKATLLVGNDSDAGYVAEALKVADLRCEPFLRRDIKPFYDMAALCRLYKILKQEQYTIVHTNTAKAGILGRFAAKMAGIPIVVHTVHGVTFHDFRHSSLRKLFIAFEQMAARLTDQFIAVGKDVQEYYLAHEIGCAEQYQVIHTGMDLERFFEAGKLSHAHKCAKRRELGLSLDDRLVGIVSRLDPGKGQQFLLQAAPQILSRFPQARFLLVGDGKDRAVLEQMIRDRHLHDYVVCTGFRADVEEMIALFDVAVFTSLWEGLPRVLVQYAAVGKPIVAFDIKGVSELVRDGFNGFTVPVKDSDSLAAQILCLLEHPAKAIQMGQNGHALIDNSWNTESMVRQIAQTYQTLLTKKAL